MCSFKYLHLNTPNKQTDIRARFSSCTLTIEQPSQKLKKRREDMAANTSRIRERKAVAKHSEMGDCKLVLTITRNGQAIPFVCPNLEEFLGATDPLSRKLLG
jgi:hypothetical protein